jgi:hypothetical protein
MDFFHPVFWIVYIVMLLFLGFFAWEIIKMLIGVFTGKFIKEERKRREEKRKREEAIRRRIKRNKEASKNDTDSNRQAGIYKFNI